MNGFLRTRVTPSCGNGRPQEGVGGASKGAGNGIIQDGTWEAPERGANRVNPQTQDLLGCGLMVLLAGKCVFRDRDSGDFTPGGGKMGVNEQSNKSPGPGC